MRNFLKFAALFSAFLAATASAYVPPLVNFQGRLNDSGGGALTDTVSITFTIYNNSAGSGLAEWTETHPAVPVINGLFSVALGTFSPLEEDVFNISTVIDRFLAISVNGGPLLQPLQKIVAVPYALRVATVDGATGGVIDGKLAIGETNTNAGNFAFVAGNANAASGNASSVTGGMQNSAGGSMSHIGGGRANIADTVGATVGGGENNTASGSNAVVSGGSGNTASGDRGAVLGGVANIASGEFSTIGAGYGNEATGNRSAVVGGEANYARGVKSFIGGGGGGSFEASDSNAAFGNYSAIVGGFGQVVRGDWANIGGGGYNRASGSFSFIGGGGGLLPADSNSTPGSKSAVVGGLRNIASGESSFIGGGGSNLALGNYSFVGGGGGPVTLYSNAATGGNSAVVGGESNTASGPRSFVGTGLSNAASSFESAVVSGISNVSSGGQSFVGGGRYNKARGLLSFVGGGGDPQAIPGDSNVAAGIGSVVVGGQDNIAVGRMATIPGGISNRAQGAFSFAAGQQALALHGGAFVWGDSTNAVFASTASNQFLVRASGGMGIGTNAPDAPFHVQEGSAGAVSGNANAAGVFERDSECWIHLISPDANQRGILFGSPSNAIMGSIRFNPPGDEKGYHFRCGNNQVRLELDSLGNLSADGCVVGSNIACPSDARLKKNVAVLSNAMLQIEQLRGVRYEWRQDLIGEREFPEGEQIGLIAQEVQQVVPQAVIKGKDGFYAVDYARLVPLLIQGMKEQQLQLDEQRKQIAELLKLVEQAVQ